MKKQDYNLEDQYYNHFSGNGNADEPFSSSVPADPTSQYASSNYNIYPTRLIPDESSWNSFSKLPPGFSNQIDVSDPYINPNMAIKHPSNFIKHSKVNPNVQDPRLSNNPELFSRELLFQTHLLQQQQQQQQLNFPATYRRTPQNSVQLRGHPAGTGGSNAQGRAINKMLLDILKERMIDPQKLDLAIESYVERMDCVNLATLLFHTGKKRFLLIPSYIKRIANRFNSLKEELRAREASNALYGLKCMSSEIPEVRELVYAIANKLSRSSSDFVAQAVGNALYGCQMMTSDYEEVRFLLLVIASKVNQCTELLEAQNIGNALYGLRGMNSEHKEVRAVISALTPKIATAREELNGQALGNSLYGLQSMSSKEVEVRLLLNVLANKVTRTWEDLKAQEVGNALYGLKRMSSDVQEVRLLISALIPKVASSPEILDAQAIGNSFYGLQNMSSNSPEILSIIGVLAEKVSLSSAELDGQAMGNSLYGLQGMKSDYPAVRSAITALTSKIQSSYIDMNAQELGNALYGLQNMSSDHIEVRRLLLALSQKISSSKHELTSQEIGNSLFGLQNMSSSHFETRVIITRLTQKIQQSHAIIDPQGVSNSFFGLKKFSNESEEVNQLLSNLSSKIEHSWKPYNTQHIANILYGLQSMTSNQVVVRNILKIIVPKIMACRESMSAKQLSQALFGLKNFYSDHIEVHALVTALAEKVSLSTDPWNLLNLSMALFGLQGLSVNVEEVSILLDMICNKFVSQPQSSQPIIDVQQLSNAFFGLQNMSCQSAEAMRMLSVLNSILLAYDEQGEQTMDAKSCANILFGLQHFSLENEIVDSVFAIVSRNVAKLVEFFEINCRTQVSNVLGSTNTGNSSSINENLLYLYQVLCLTFPDFPEIQSTPSTQSSLRTSLESLERIISQVSSQFKPRPLTSPEKKLVSDLNQALSQEPFDVSSSEFLYGFEVLAVVRLIPNVHLKSKLGVSWNPVVIFEIEGTSYDFPLKKHFIQLRNKYFENEKGVKVITLPYKSFIAESTNGFASHLDVFEALSPNNENDKKAFDATLCKLGLISSSGLLSSLPNSINKLKLDPQINAYAQNHSTIYGGSQTQGDNWSKISSNYHDDDFKKTINIDFSEVSKNKMIASCTGRGPPLGLLLNWNGNWPTLSMLGINPNPGYIAHSTHPRIKSQAERYLGETRTMSENLIAKLSHLQQTHGNANFFGPANGKNHNSSSQSNLALQQQLRFAALGLGNNPLPPGSASPHFHDNDLSFSRPFKMNPPENIAQITNPAIYSKNFTSENYPKPFNDQASIQSLSENLSSIQLFGPKTGNLTSFPNDMTDISSFSSSSNSILPIPSESNKPPPSISNSYPHGVVSNDATKAIYSQMPGHQEIDHQSSNNDQGFFLSKEQRFAQMNFKNFGMARDRRSTSLGSRSTASESNSEVSESEIQKLICGNSELDEDAEIIREQLKMEKIQARIRQLREKKVKKGTNSDDNESLKNSSNEHEVPKAFAEQA